MQKYFIYIALNLSILFPFIIAPENPTESNFPGGYVTIAMQFGKESNDVNFRSYQVNIGASIGSPLMIGLTIGKRNFNNGKSYYFFDLQGNIIFLLGGGIGFISEDYNIHHRKKFFGGLGPLMYSIDWVSYKDNRGMVENSGTILALPILTIFGNSFHP